MVLVQQLTRIFTTARWLTAPSIPEQRYKGHRMASTSIPSSLTNGPVLPTHPMSGSLSMESRSTMHSTNTAAEMGVLPPSGPRKWGRLALSMTGLALAGCGSAATIRALQAALSDSGSSGPGFTAIPDPGLLSGYGRPTEIVGDPSVRAFGTCPSLRPR